MSLSVLYIALFFGINTNIRVCFYSNFLFPSSPVTSCLPHTTVSWASVYIRDSTYTHTRAAYNARTHALHTVLQGKLIYFLFFIIILFFIYIYIYNIFVINFIGFEIIIVLKPELHITGLRARATFLLLFRFFCVLLRIIEKKIYFNLKRMHKRYNKNKFVQY